MDCTEDNIDLNSSLSDFFAQNDTSIYSSAKIIDKKKVQNDNQENELEVDGNFPNVIKTEILLNDFKIY